MNCLRTHQNLRKIAQNLYLEFRGHKIIKINIELNNKYRLITSNLIIKC